MNIFILHRKQRKIARYHVDSHVVKMLLETCQLLYTAHWVSQYKEMRLPISKRKKKLSEYNVPESMIGAPLTKNNTYYKPTHINHPCAIWTYTSYYNYMWLALLAIELSNEYVHRYNKNHACREHAIWLYLHSPPNIPTIPMTPFVIAMADEYIISKDPIICYRYYYNTAKRKKGIIRYTRRHIPHFLEK